MIDGAPETLWSIPDKELKAACRNLDDVLHIMQHGDLYDCTDLPTFGGAEPECTSEIWSWDETRLLVGSGGYDLEIVTRNEFNGG